ncbi:hypothetical protein QBC40DRAFT_319452 [Triangularia verruculosa]|uniref:Uncharacterized protein n=1 Tax=Triangularia verruculosa TaxID=2587418 RepID=A0AAN6X7J3_9PEZI|nr:hypothetical protein QBC40DRAFT_319452 [Triangularia verruculosa]
MTFFLHRINSSKGSTGSFCGKRNAAFVTLMMTCYCTSVSALLPSIPTCSALIRVRRLQPGCGYISDFTAVTCEHTRRQVPLRAFETFRDFGNNTDRESATMPGPTSFSKGTEKQRSQPPRANPPPPISKREELRLQIEKSWREAVAICRVLDSMLDDPRKRELKKMSGAELKMLIGRNFDKLQNIQGMVNRQRAGVRLEAGQGPHDVTDAYIVLCNCLRELCDDLLSLIKIAVDRKNPVGLRKMTANNIEDCVEIEKL